MSNVAIKLIAVSGVVGLGLLMFLQAQKGMQSGEIEKQLSQLESLNAEDSQPASLGETGDLSDIPEQMEPSTESKNIPFEQVPAELSKLASRIATPLEKKLEKKIETPFSPNTNENRAVPKIKLTAATEESQLEEPKPFAAPEPTVTQTPTAPVKGLDFRTATEPEKDTPTLSENPFSNFDPVEKVEPKKTEPPAVAQTEFKTGPQFGSVPTPDDPARLEGFKKTNVPPRETLPEETAPANPFEAEKSAPSKPAPLPVPDRLAFGEKAPELKKEPAINNDSPALKLETNDSPFEIQEETKPETPTIEENPFLPTPAKPEKKKSVTLPVIETPSKPTESKFNPFSEEPAEKTAPAVEPKPATVAPPSRVIESLPNKGLSFPVESNNPVIQTPPAKAEPKSTPQPFPAEESSDVVVIKKRKTTPSLQEPSLFNLKSEPAESGKTAAEPIELSPSPEPKPLSLVEEKQPQIQASEKLDVQQKVQSPKMTIQKLAPPEAVLGQPFIYHVLVKNTGSTSAQDVVVEDRIPQGAKLTGTIPRAEQIKDRIIWRLGAMDPGAEKKISIRVIPETAGQLGSVATVNFATKVVSETKITAPQISLKTDLPTAVKPGEITTVNYTITNSGSGDAKNVYLRSIIPPQFSHPGGDDIEYSIGVLPAGETKQVLLQLKAIKPGAGKNISSVMGDGNIKVAAETPLKVIGTSEQFLLTRKGPETRYLGQAAVYENVVTNNSEKTIQNISIFESVPPGMKYLSSSANGQYDSKRNVVQWDLAELGSGDRQVFTIKLEPIEVGKMVSTVQIITDNNTQQSANLQSETTILGQPLLKVETSELKGSLAIGEKMTMQMQLINQGSASATNVEFRVKIPKELMFVSAKGPVRYKQVGSYVIFEPAQELLAKQTLNFALTFAAQNKGDARVLVQVQSKQMEKPLSQEEAISVLDQLQ